MLAAMKKVEAIIELGQAWSDPEFPPCASSIANHEDGVEK